MKNKTNTIRKQSEQQLERNAQELTALIHGLNLFDEDRDKEDRENEQLCKVCMYFKEVPDKLTAPLHACMICSKPCSNTDWLCVTCATTYDACRHCTSPGTDKRTVWPEDEWVVRHMKNSRYESELILVALRTNVMLMYQDVLKSHRLSRGMCPMCYYIHRCHERKNALLRHKICRGCQESLASIKDIPFAFCGNCSKQHHACRYCGQLLKKKG